MVELGLASRDAVAMAADIEDMTGVTLSVAVAFQHPTIESLATRIVEGEPERDDDDLDGADWTRTGPAERVDIAVVGLSHPAARRHEQPRRNLAGADGRPRRHHRPARGPLVGVPRRAPAGRADQRRRAPAAAT